MERFELPTLDYAYDALEPYYDARTIELHHSKHHQGYVAGFNAAADKLGSARAAGDYAAVKHLERELAFHGGGHLLHSVFWKNMCPGGGGQPTGEFAAAITTHFGDIEAFDKQLRASSVAVEGSGWGVVAANSAGELVILQVEKHQNQLIPGWMPILVIDVWEHAYYLKYQNRRAEFVDAFMDHLVNWNDVTQRFARVVA
jgi:Fe-Mn family superoxide dismutase